jgi:predicted ATPase
MERHKIKRVKIAGFRRLRNIELNMRPMMVMIGANGVGKSSVMDAFSLLSAAADGVMNKALNELGGLSELCTYGQNKVVNFDIEAENSASQALCYSLEIATRGSGYGIPLETLIQKKDGQAVCWHIDSRFDDIKYFDVSANNTVQPSWTHNPLESSLAQVPKMFKTPDELRQALSSAVKYHVLDVGSRAPVKLPQQMKPVLSPGVNGENLLPFLYNLRESEPERYEIIEDTLRVAFPGFKGLSFPPVAAGMLSLSWKETFFSEPVYAHQLSEGILRFLWLVSLLQSPQLPAVTMIDEPEVSLHPELLNLLVDLMREASKRTRLIIATHSDAMIRFLKPEETLVMSLDESGFAAVNWAENMDLDEWLKDYSLDELWRMGRMGGRS